jgi:hypothetical protein
MTVPYGGWVFQVEAWFSALVQVWFVIESGWEYGRILGTAKGRMLAPLAIALSEC